MGMKSAKIIHQPFSGTYDIFEQPDFFKQPTEIEFEKPEEFMAIDQDEEALEQLEKLMHNKWTPRSIEPKEIVSSKASNSFMESPETLDDEQAWLDRSDVSKLMNEMKLKYMKREFKDLQVTKFSREIPESEDQDDLERKRSMELIYLDQQVYLVIKEAVKEVSTDEIYYNLIVLKYDPKT